MRQTLTLVMTLLATVLTLSHTTPAHATTMLRVDVPEMTLTSEWVVRARVVDVKSVDLRSEGRGIFTDVTLQMRETYRGIDVPETLATVPTLCTARASHSFNPPPPRWSGSQRTW